MDPRSLVPRDPKPWAPVTRLGYQPEGPWLKQREHHADGATTLGLSALSALAVAGIWSSLNPGYAALRSLPMEPEVREAAREGLWIGLCASAAAALGVGFAFDRWVPALVSGLTGLALFGVSMHAVNQAPENPTPAA